MSVSDLPALNAGLNGLSGLLLLVGLGLVRAGHKRAHALCMGSAFAVSCAFLVTYVLHKILVKGVHTPFGGEGGWRTFYYGMLLSHILLAIAIVPMVLVTMRHALRGEVEKHRAIARVTWPVWIYVSATGVLVYFMLYRWFPHGA